MSLLVEYLRYYFDFGEVYFGLLPLRLQLRMRDWCQDLLISDSSTFGL